MLEGDPTNGRVGGSMVDVTDPEQRGRRPGTAWNRGAATPRPADERGGPTDQRGGPTDQRGGPTDEWGGPADEWRDPEAGWGQPTAEPGQPAGPPPWRGESTGAGQPWDGRPATGPAHAQPRPRPRRRR